MDMLLYIYIEPYRAYIHVFDLIQKMGEGDEEGGEVESELRTDGEILDEITTGRGELKVRTLSFRREASPTCTREPLKIRSVSFRDERRLHVSLALYILCMHYVLNFINLILISWFIVFRFIQRMIVSKTVNESII